MGDCLRSLQPPITQNSSWGPLKVHQVIHVISTVAAPQNYIGIFMGRIHFQVIFSRGGRNRSKNMSQHCQEAQPTFIELVWLCAVSIHPHGPLAGQTLVPDLHILCLGTRFGKVLANTQYLVDVSIFRCFFSVSGVREPEEESRAGGRGCVRFY